MLCDRPNNHRLQLHHLTLYKQLRTKYAECTLIQLSSVASNQSKRLAFTSSTHGAVSRRPEGEGAAVTRGHSRCPDRGCRVGCGHAVQQRGVHGAAAGRCSGSDPAARPVAQEHFALALQSPWMSGLGERIRMPTRRDRCYLAALP